MSNLCSFTSQMFLQFRWQLRRMMWNDRTCGRHALNKLLQGANFTDDDMARIQLRTASSVLEDAALHGDPRGDWSIEVLGHALRSKGFDMQMRIPAAGQTIAGMLGDSQGMLNWVGAHYFAYIRHSGAVYRLDSASSSVKMGCPPCRHTFCSRTLCVLVHRASEAR